MLHGTTFGNLPGILRQGLRPHAGSSPHQTKTHDAVFFTDSEEAVVMYATGGRDLEHASPEDQPVILTVDTTGLPLEPDYDDAGLTIEVDLAELNRELAEQGFAPVAIGQQVGEHVEDLICEVFDDDGGERPEPFMLEVEDGRLTVANPYVRIGLPTEATEAASYQVYDELDTGWEDGRVFLLARQWLCRCVVPYDRITGVYITQALLDALKLVPKQPLARSTWTDPSVLEPTGDPEWPFAWRQLDLLYLPKPALDALLARRFRTPTDR